MTGLFIKTSGAMSPRGDAPSDAQSRLPKQAGRQFRSDPNERPASEATPTGRPQATAAQAAELAEGLKEKQNYFATLKASCLTSSKRSVAAINDYWAAQGIEARAEIGPDGSISSRINVRKHIPKAEDRA